MKKPPYVWMPGMVGIEHYELDDDLRIRFDDNEKPARFKGSSPGEVSLDLTDPATIGCLLVQVSHKVRKEKEAAILKAQDEPILEIFKVSHGPCGGKMYPVREPMPVNDILVQALKEIAVDGFRHPLRIGSLLLSALEAAG